MPREALRLGDARAVWDEIRPGLEAVKAKSHAPWRPEDVYAALLAGRAFLYLGEPGFVIVEPKEDPFTGEGELLVWIAYSREVGAVERFQEAVDDLARTHGFTKLTLWSDRPGWEKTPGWQQVSAIYERRLA